MDRHESPATKLPVSLYALRSALGRPPLWLLACLVPAISALIIAQPWYRWYDNTIDHHYAPGALVANLDDPFLTDHSAEIDGLNTATGQLGAVLAMLAMLAYAFCAGGWLQVFLERTEGHSVRSFFYGGTRYFWRFFRVLLISLPLMHLAGWLVYGGPWKLLVQEWLLGDTDGSLENLDSEWAAVWVTWIQDGLHAALFALILGWGIYTRTRLALLGSRSSIFAGFSTAFLILRHPIRTLRPLLALFLLELLVLVFVVGSFSSGVESGIGADSTAGAVWGLIALTLLALLWRAVVWGAQYSAAVQVSRAIVPPPLRPDPWKERIGGPGGPQYPLGGEGDEYSVSI